ncbi:ArsR family transcriptional regulator [Ruminococcus sp. AM40-10AC]|nr:ArsR family transcriptional regulator [Ruminococcus sp. AF14-5]RHT13990.1 ArsR family transcriptional regulator [Ruminococcus sp. AM40-10AC]
MFLLNLLKGGRLSAGEICEYFSVTGASISRHLAILKDADLISSTSIRLCHMLIRLV